jgi:hypothetical protein
MSSSSSKSEDGTEDGLTNRASKVTSRSYFVHGQAVWSHQYHYVLCIHRSKHQLVQIDAKIQIFNDPARYFVFCIHVSLYSSSYYIEISSSSRLVCLYKDVTTVSTICISSPAVNTSYKHTQDCGCNTLYGYLLYMVQNLFILY